MYSEKVPTTQETTDTIMYTGVPSDEVVPAIEKFDVVALLYTGTHQFLVVAVSSIAIHSLSVVSVLLMVTDERSLLHRSQVLTSNVPVRVPFSVVSTTIRSWPSFCIQLQLVEG